LGKYFLIVAIFSFVSVAIGQPKPGAKKAIESNSIKNGSLSEEIQSKQGQRFFKEAAQIDTSVKKVNPVKGYQGSPDSTIRIGVMISLDADVTVDRLYNYMRDKETMSKDAIKLTEGTRDGLDFLEGLQYALSTGNSKQKIDLYIFDTHNSDSIVQEMVKGDSLRICDIIIGPPTQSQAKTVSAFCKKNHIINIQPFVASKVFSSENPYLVRFMPTIDAHLQKEYEMIMDNYDDKNIIVYTTKKERDQSAARQLDTLFRSYNAINTRKLQYTVVNSNDTTLPAAKRNISYYLRPKDLNVVMLMSYDEPLVNSQLRLLREKEGSGKNSRYKDSVIILGMPTWIDADQIRPDYLSEAQPYFSDPYYADTTTARVQDFVARYTAVCNQKPSRHSYMGYDAMSYLSLIFDKYGKSFAEGFNNESFEGLGYSFHISPMIRNPKGGGTPVINYYSNTAMHLYQVRDYKVWLVK
jgi:ABC-type branched-subunit amino acid transport system substrate-binding protein